ncbi:uncharacterized protein LOC133891207 [Phragmites australis]|uniref:uncharacterized protein LOC133891207 n=1 Tax=Phragmites australis TaxID=29695 RepID=UPI002D78A308|nr:uncharacterized protein LOC133891207 [Phragmites australis]
MPQRIYTTITKDVFDLIHKLCSSAFTVWNTIEGLFRSNELQHAAYFEAEFDSPQQDDMSISYYCASSKHSPTTSVTLLQIPIPHLHERPSYLLLVELHELHDAKMEASQGLFIGHDGSPSSVSGPADAGPSFGSNRNKNGNKKRGRSSGSNSDTSSAPGGTGSAPQQRHAAPGTPWAAGYNRH